MSTAFHDPNPLLVNADDVTPRGIFTIPVTLRDHAHAMLPGDLPGHWWTIGEFRDTDGEFTTVVARRTPGGAMSYGISD
jgi:hypothetical protein